MALEWLEGKTIAVAVPAAAFLLRVTTIFSVGRGWLPVAAKERADGDRSLLASLAGFSLASFSLVQGDLAASAKASIALGLMLGFSCYLSAFLVDGLKINRWQDEVSSAFAHAGHMSLAVFVGQLGSEYVGKSPECEDYLLYVPGLLAVAMAVVANVWSTVREHKNARSGSGGTT